MVSIKWKTIAIIFITLFVIQSLFIGLSYYSVASENKAINECYYNTCSENPDADYENGVCTCYDYDVLGNLIIVKTEFKS